MFFFKSTRKSGKNVAGWEGIQRKFLPENRRRPGRGIF